MKKILRLICAISLLAGCSDSDKEREIIESLEDVDGKPAAVLTGSVQDMLLTKECPHSRILRAETETDTYVLVSTGKVSAVLTSGISWRLACKEYPELVKVGDGINPAPVGFAFNKNSGTLLKQFNAYLAKIISEGKVEELIDKWTDIDSGPKMPVSPSPSTANGTLHVVVSAITPPYNFVMNGRISGVEPEIVAGFAESLGMSWEFVNVNFSGLIAYMQTDKADIGCSIMCITPERSQSVDFSIPYIHERSVLIVNEKYAPSGESSDITTQGMTLLQTIRDSFVKSVIAEDRYLILLKGLKSTMLISILSAIFGTLLGIFLCYTMKRKNRLVSGLSNIYIEIMRCMPQVVLLMIMFYVVFGNSDIDGAWVAVISFSLCFGAYTSVIFRSAVDSIDKGQTEAALSMGFSKVGAFVNIIIPQAVQRALPVYRGEFIGLVKATSIVGYIAVLDLTKAGDIIRSRTYEALFPLLIITVVYFLVIWVLGVALKFIERETQPSRKKFFK